VVKDVRIIRESRRWRDEMPRSGYGVSATLEAITNLGGRFAPAMYIRSLALLVSIFLFSACSDGGAKPVGLASAPPSDFVLRTAHGPLDSQSLRGNVLLVYFGYTNCPDIWPSTLATAAQAMNMLKPEERARTRLIIISVDPARDTLEKLKEYAAYFHPAMIGATGTAAEIAAAARTFGVSYALQPPRPDGGYAVDHSADTYLVAPDGRLTGTQAFATPPEKLAAAIRKLL